MDSFEINKIFGALTGAFMVYLSITFVTEGMFGSGHGSHGHGEESLAFFVELEEDDGPAPEPEPTLSLAQLVAQADAGAGARVFNRCSSCHNVDPGGRNGLGPALHGIMGREIAAAADFSYSDALAGRGGAWDWAAMDGFLEAPSDWAPGTRMNFRGLGDPEDRANLMAWLNAQSDAPIAPPTEE